MIHWLMYEELHGNQWTLLKGTGWSGTSIIIINTVSIITWPFPAMLSFVGIFVSQATNPHMEYTESITACKKQSISTFSMGKLGCHSNPSVHGKWPSICYQWTMDDPLLDEDRPPWQPTATERETVWMISIVWYNFYMATFLQWRRHMNFEGFFNLCI